MDTKCCAKCKEVKPVGEFSKNRSTKDGLRSYCKPCDRANNNKWKKENPEKTKAGKARWQKENPEKVKAMSAKYRKENPEKVKSQRHEHYKKNRERIRATVSEWKKNNRNWRINYEKERKKSDPLFKLVGNIRSRTRNALKSKNFKKNKKFHDYIGCTIEVLAAHLESKFDANMNWGNQGTYWHIDHIIPLASAKTVDELMKLCHYSNLQPLEGIENMKKGAKI